VPHLVQTLPGFVILAPQAVRTAKVEQHHSPGRADGAGVALRGPLPSWGRNADADEKLLRARGQPDPPPLSHSE
jgi:hypothetical protein